MVLKRRCASASPCRELAYTAATPDKVSSEQSQDDRRLAAPQSPQPIPQSASEFAKQPQPRRMGEATGAAGGLDRQGRLPAGESVHDDDELEIPAFLRRQSN